MRTRSDHEVLLLSRANSRVVPCGYARAVVWRRMDSLVNAERTRYCDGGSDGH